MNVLCIIADVVGSRTVQHRAKLQKKLDTSLKGLNAKRAKQILSPFTITLGDEFQVVYAKSETVFLDMWSILCDLHPVRVRFSLGLGQLSTPINRKEALGMDGPAFHSARAGMSELKRSNNIFAITASRKDPPKWTQPAIELISHNARTWRKPRHLVLRHSLAGMDPKSIAKLAGISTAAVYKNISAGALGPTAELLKQMKEWLESNR